MKKKKNSSRKRRKKMAKVETSIMTKENYFMTESQGIQQKLCRNKQLYVATKTRLNSMKKQNFVAIKSFYVATLLKKLVKKIVATLFTLSLL